MIKVGFGIRVAVWLIDLVFVVMFFGISVYFLDDYLYSLIPSLLFYYLLEVLTDKSLGKMIFGLSIRREDGNKSTIMQRAFRALIKHLTIIAFLSILVLLILYFIQKITHNPDIYDYYVFPVIASYSTFWVIYYFVCAPKGKLLHDLLFKTAVFQVS